MNNDEKDPGASKDPIEETFGEPISVYTTDQAIEDGILFEVGRLLNRRIVLTTNLVYTLKKEALAFALVTGLSKAAEFPRPDLAVYTIDGHKIYADDNGETITIMLAEDY